ncbi:PDZ domain-containing protein [Flaviaesturariibacter amylovorans]|uniref:PDZ domain-containing protein n=1 Tax=Flaviaesturariibacter amylovorans TaxID=1084520 RepID=A0ABP8GAF8_9BACT
MKQYIFKGLVVMSALAALPAAAQTGQGGQGTDNKEKQVIVITRDNNLDEKTTIEIKGNKVTINGKDADKSDDVNVNVHTTKPGSHMSINGIGGRNTWVFSDDDGSSLFSEDENRAMLGVITEIGTKGAQVTSVTKESAAEKAGIKKGDVITKIGTEKIDSDGDVARAIRSRKPGEKVAISLLRDGKEQTVNAELGKWKGMNMGTFVAPRINMNDFRVMAPSAPHTPYTYYGHGGRPRLGISIQDTEDGKGVKVTDVDDDSHADKAGLKKDDVITKVEEDEVNSTDDLRRHTSRIREGSTYNFKVQRGGKEQTITVRIPKKLKTADL